MIIISCSTGLVLLLFYGTAFMYSKRGWFSKFYHDLLGWHQPTNELELHGINLCSVCKFCGKKIIQDSQGNWFDTFIDGEREEHDL